jgi:hypothetical protein
MPGHPEAIYTHYTGESPTRSIDVTTYPKLKPFFIDPGDTLPRNYLKARDGQLLRIVALLDPFVALHGYTGLSPITSIKLPDWTVETALKKMTAFFHLDPLLRQRMYRSSTGGTSSLQTTVAMWCHTRTKGCRSPQV